MTAKDLVMSIDKPHFVVRLYSNVLEVDLKEGIKRDLERAVEAKPALRESLGLLFQTVVPLDVELKNIESVKIDKQGKVKVSIPSRRDFHIPLDESEVERFVDKLNELIAKEKEIALKNKEEAMKTERAFGRKEKERARGDIR